MSRSSAGAGTQDGGETEEPGDAPTPPATGKFPWNGHHVAHVERPPQSGHFGESPSALYPGLTEHALKKKIYPLSKIKLTDVRFGLKGKKAILYLKQNVQGQREVKGTVGCSDLPRRSTAPPAALNTHVGTFSLHAVQDIDFFQTFQT